MFITVFDANAMKVRLLNPQHIISMYENFEYGVHSTTTIELPKRDIDVRDRLDVILEQIQHQPKVTPSADEDDGRSEHTS
jgi:hypothetical protein